MSRSIDGGAEAIEGRTQELGRRLHSLVRRYRLSPRERVQDWLMALLLEDDTLRNRVLRFVDVLAALPADRSGLYTASLFREYFRGSFSHLPVAVRLLLRAGASGGVPAPLLSAAVRRGTQLIAGRFIVPPGPHSVEHVLARLHGLGRYPSFDLLGEAVISDREARAYKERYLHMVHSLGSHPGAGMRTTGGAPRFEVSLKLSSLTSQFNPADPEGTLRRVGLPLREICEAASQMGIGVTVDAEQYSYRDLAWYIVRSVLEPGGPLGQWADAGVVVQTYLRDAERHAQEVIAFARLRGVPLKVRLVKGAYWDYEAIVSGQAGWPVPVHLSKGSTDVSFEGLVRVFLESSPAVRLAVGSHNLRSQAYAEAVRESLGLPEGAVEHQTLYQTLEGLSRAMPHLGWPTRDYVPVGELIPGMAYLVRRILENTSQAGFLTRARLGEDVSELLESPSPGVEDMAHRRPGHSTGFTSVPGARLFDPAERRRFREALDAVQGESGATYSLHIGRDRVDTEVVVPQSDPSHPEAPPLGRVHWAGPREVERAISVAREGALLWGKHPVEYRVEVMLRAAGALRENRDRLAAWVVHEGGRTWPEALADVEEAIDHVSWNSLQLRQQSAGIAANYRPRGVVACISPWNFPVALPAGMTSAALLAGNAVILKPAEETSIVAVHLVDAFHQAGVPREALILLPGPGESVGVALVESPGVDMVAFTGSKDVGAWVHRTVARVTPDRGGIKRDIAEMGGKNAIVVFPDADMDEALRGVLRSAFSHAGQKCSACSRVIVHERIFEQMAMRLVEGARSLPVGPAEDPGTIINPLINVAARDRVLEYGDVARREGRVLLDTLDAHGDGLCLGPMIVEVDKARAASARVAQEEIFGPVLTLLSFRSREEAISLVNGTGYALTLGIFSRSLDTIHSMVSGCHAGNIYVNRETVGARPGIEPFGGYRLSGTGPKTGGEEYVLAFMTRRSGFRSGEAGTHEATHHGSLAPLVQGLHPWSVGAASRHRLLSVAFQRLKGDRASLEEAVAGWKGLEADQAMGVVEQTLEVIAHVLDLGFREVVQQQPTVEVPGQTNFTLWETARGVGAVAVDDGSSPQTLAGLIWGSLLAGNGTLVAGPEAAGSLCHVLAGALHRAGVPRESLVEAPPATTPGLLGDCPIQFAAVDLSLEATRRLYRALGATTGSSGQDWLKALISMSEGPLPGEAGFARLFAHPKTVAIRTLRHGADLRLL